MEFEESRDSQQNENNNSNQQSKNYYAVLNLDKNCSGDDIKNAYQKVKGFYFFVKNVILLFYYFILCYFIGFFEI